MKIYTQPFHFKQWYAVEAEWYKRWLFKLSFGRFGRMEYINMREREMVRYFSGYTEWSSKPSFEFKGVKSAPAHVNCRCEVTL